MTDDAGAARPQQKTAVERVEEALASFTASVSMSMDNVLSSAWAGFAKDVYGLEAYSLFLEWRTINRLLQEERSWLETMEATDDSEEHVATQKAVVAMLARAERKAGRAMGEAHATPVQHQQ